MNESEVCVKREQVKNDGFQKNSYTTPELSNCDFRPSLPSLSRSTATKKKKAAHKSFWFQKASPPLQKKKNKISLDLYKPPILSGKKKKTNC